MSSDIDFTAFHHWPDNWLDNSTSFETSWVAKHIADAATLGKPVSCCICKKKKRKEKTTPFGVDLMRSPVLYRAAQMLHLQLDIRMIMISN